MTAIDQAIEILESRHLDDEEARMAALLVLKEGAQ
jgi:hypothetical protein